VSRPGGAATLRLIGGPTALIAYCGLRILTDPTFDPPGERRSSGTPVVLTKLAGPAVAAGDIGPIDVVLVSHDHHSDNLDTAGREVLRRAERVLTTTAGAERLGEGTTGLAPGDASTPHAAVEAARLLEPAVIVPVHQEGWAHFTSGPDELARAFAEAGLMGRLRPVAPGETVELS